MFQKKMTADPDVAGDAMTLARPGVAPGAMLGGKKKFGKGGTPFGKGGSAPSKSGGFSKGGGVANFRGGKR
jgi:hypothetical protein